MVGDQVGGRPHDEADRVVYSLLILQGSVIREGLMGNVFRVRRPRPHLTAGEGDDFLDVARIERVQAASAWLGGFRAIDQNSRFFPHVDAVAVSKTA